MTGGEHDDDVADAVALVLCVLGEDTEGFGAIVRNCDSYGVLVSLAKLLGELVGEQSPVPAPDQVRH